jgi:UDP-4-amino-4,6-dideoxy-N-acetyl-beta-L-altrosamine transaminase
MSNSDLAIEGGTPVRATPLPYGRPWVEADDVQAVTAALTSDWLTTGPRVAAFEAAFARTVGAPHAVAVSSGTAALHAAACAAGIGPGDEVIVPVLTFAASASCVRFQGGTVVFVDVREDTLNLDVARAEAAVTPRTRAILTVDYTGQPSDIEEIRALAANHRLLVIEDACQALGATYRGRPVGSFTPLTAFSLHPLKAITSGEGGVVTTDRADVAERMRAFRNHGITNDGRRGDASWYYEIEELGYNYRLTDVQCALGESQLGKLAQRIARRREIAARYTAAFQATPQLLPPAVASDRESAWNLYILRLDLDRLRVDRATVYRALRAENIGVNVHYLPVAWHPYYQKLGYQKGQWPAAERAYEQMLSLPIFPSMTDRDIADVIDAVAKVVHGYTR